MAAKRHERTYARKQAIQVLYQAEILEVSPNTLLEDANSFVDGAQPSHYASMLVGGVSQHRVAIDSLLKRYSENWAIGRMPTVDRAILRLSCFEMGYVDEVPVSVTINEAVELAKEFGGEDDSPRFVNGVLGRIAEYLEEQGHMPDAPAVSADAAAGSSEAAEPDGEGADATGRDGE